MTEFTREDIENIAELAKLDLTEEEIELYGEQLRDILDYVDILNSLDTEDIAPTASVLPIVNALRKDEIQDGLSPEQALANAPAKEAQQFKVNAVMDA